MYCCLCCVCDVRVRGWRPCWCGCDECVYGCGSGVLASARDVLEISVVRGVGGVYAMCMYFARGGVGGVGKQQQQQHAMCMCLARGGVEGVGVSG